MVVGANGGNRAGSGAPGGDVTESPAVLALRVPSGRVCTLDRPRKGKETARGAHCWDVAGVDRDDDRRGGLAFSRLCIRVEISGGNDANILGVKDQLREAGEHLVLVFRQEGDGETLDCELGLVGGKAKGPPGGYAQGERLVELGGQSVKVRRAGGSGGVMVSGEQGNRTAVVDLSPNSEGEDTGCISKDTSSDVGEGGHDQRSLRVLRGGGTGSVESSFGPGERLRCLNNRHAFADSRDFGGCERAFIVLALWSARRGSFGIRGLRFGAVRGKMPGDQSGGVRVLPLLVRVGFP